MPAGLSPTALLAILQPWAGVAEPIHRRIAQLADIESEPAREVLWVGCGSGRSVLWWAERYRTHGVGVDPDPKAIEAAERAAREAGLQALVTFQTADPGNLPHEAQVFDVAVVHVLQLPGQHAAAIREAGRVARPMGSVLALVPSWQREPTPEQAADLAALGIEPQLLVEWKSHFRDGGVVELIVEDATSNASWMATGWFGLLARAWRAAGWAGVLLVLSRPFRVLRVLALSGVLGLSIIKGTRWPHA